MILLFYDNEGAAKINRVLLGVLNPRFGLGMFWFVKELTRNRNVMDYSLSLGIPIILLYRYKNRKFMVQDLKTWMQVQIFLILLAV